MIFPFLVFIVISFLIYLFSKFKDCIAMKTALFLLILSLITMFIRTFAIV